MCESEREIDTTALSGTIKWIPGGVEIMSKIVSKLQVLVF